MPTLTPALAYLRVSGKGQIDGDGFPRQLEAIERYAKASGVQILKVYREEGVSGTTEWDNRPAWVEMLTSLGECDTIVIERLDRLARDLMVQEHILADLKRRRINLVSVCEPDLGSTDPTRVLLRQIMGAIAQYDRAMVVLKLRGARQRIKARGDRCEGRKRFGEHPGEAEVLTIMQNASRAGKTPSAIARLLNEQGLKPRSGKEWHPYAVSRILAAQPPVQINQASKPSTPPQLTDIRADVFSALQNLGCAKTAAENAVRAVETQGQDFDSLFRAALQLIRPAA